MTSIIYEDDNGLRRAGARFDFANADATKHYLTHYENYLTLKFFAMNKLATFAEKQRANKELVVCERKLEYWRRHPNFDTERANRGVVSLQNLWNE